jgi:hypothetical protein
MTEIGMHEGNRIGGSALGSAAGLQQGKQVSRMDEFEGQIGELIRATKIDLDRLADMSGRLLGNPPTPTDPGAPQPVPNGQVGRIQQGIYDLLGLRVQIRERIAELEALG